MPDQPTLPPGINGLALEALRQASTPGKLREGLNRLGSLHRFGELGEGDGPKIVAYLRELQANLRGDARRIDECIVKLRGPVPPAGSPLAPTPVPGYTAPAPERAAERMRGGLTKGEETDEGTAGETQAAADAYRAAVADEDDDRANMARRLQPFLNAYLKTLPQQTCEEKRALVRLLNAELSLRGLAVKCPNSGLPSRLQVDPGEYPEVGRFQFYHHEGGKKVKSASPTRLPELEVVLADAALLLQDALPGDALVIRNSQPNSKPRKKS